MKEKITLIVPPVVCHNLDPHTGIPFMPHMAAHMAGSLHQNSFDVQIIDAFGLQPHEVNHRDDFMLLGVNEKWIVNQIRPLFVWSALEMSLTHPDLYSLYLESRSPKEAQSH